jgi:hypothetical protein
MTASVVADSVVNLCAAIGLAVAMVALYRRDAKGPLTRRLLVALGFAALLFFTRGIAWWTGRSWLDRLSLVPAALVPLGALVLTEGMLRRHAPRAVKLAAIIGAVVLGLGGLLGLADFAFAYSVALSSFQLAGFATCLAPGHSRSEHAHDIGKSRHRPACDRCARYHAFHRHRFSAARSRYPGAARRTRRAARGYRAHDRGR